MKSVAEVAQQTVPATEAPNPPQAPQSAAAAALTIPAAAMPTAQPQDRRATLELLNIIAQAGMLQDFARGVIEAELARDSFNQDYRLATVFANSGVFADINGTTELQGIATAMAKIQLGRSWGLTPADAMEFIYFTNGRPAIMNELIAAKIREAGYDWDTQWHAARTANTDADPVCTGCTLWLKKWDGTDFKPVLDRQGKEVSASFTVADATRALIWEKGKQIPLTEKWNFKSWPREMYFWRCIGRLKKFYVTNVLRGAVSIDEAQEMPQITDPAGHRAAIDEGSREFADAAGARKVDDLRSKGFKIHEIPATRDNETSTRQNATDDAGGASSTTQQETSTQAAQEAVEGSPGKTDAPAPELTTFQQSVAQYEESIGHEALTEILGVHGCENLQHVNEANWKAIAQNCEEKLKNIRKPGSEPESTPVKPKLQFGKRP